MIGNSLQEDLALYNGYIIIQLCVTECIQAHYNTMLLCIYRLRHIWLYIPVYSTLKFSERRIPFCGNGLYRDGPEMRGFAKTLFLAIAVDHPTCFYQVYL